MILPRPPEESAPKNLGNTNGKGTAEKPVTLLDELELPELDLELLLEKELKLEALLEELRLDKLLMLDKLEGELLLLLDEGELLLKKELKLLVDGIELRLDIDGELTDIDGAKELVLLTEDTLAGINAFMFADVELAPSGINTATAVEVTEELAPILALE